MVQETQAERGARIVRRIASESLEADDSVQQPDDDADRHARIALLAYRKALTRGLAPGGELDDWLAAERESEADRSADSAR